MTKEESSSEGSFRNQVDWYKVDELLSIGQYEEVAALLYDTQEASQHISDTILTEILAAAHQICLACNQCQAEVAWHQKAHKEAIQRERELKQHLQRVMDRVRGYGRPETRTGQVGSPAASMAEPRRSGRDDPHREKHLNLWQRVQKVLGREVSRRLSGQEVPTESIELPATSLTEETEGAAVDPSDKAKRLSLPSLEGGEGPIPPLPEETIEVSPSPVAEAELPFIPSPVEDKPDQQSPPALIVHCFGTFKVYQDDQQIQDWISNKGKAIFKYLVSHPEQHIAKEVLMALFWPDAKPDAARNNLNVAIYGLRQTLRQIRPDYPHILFRDEHYLLNPELQIWVDVEAFMGHFRRARELEQHGELALAVQEYRAAEALYQGEFLADDRYEDWLFPRRQGLEADYLNLLDRLSRYYLDQENYDACITRCEKALAVEPSQEETHCRLMRCYSQQEQRYLALRQYHLCVEILARELDVSPSQTTIELYEQIRQRQ